jgi:hypothetical protein
MLQNEAPNLYLINIGGGLFAVRGLRYKTHFSIRPAG